MMDGPLCIVQVQLELDCTFSSAIFYCPARWYHHRLVLSNFYLLKGHLHALFSDLTPHEKESLHQPPFPILGVPNMATNLEETTVAVFSDYAAPKDLERHDSIGD